MRKQLTPKDMNIDAHWLQNAATFIDNIKSICKELIKILEENIQVTENQVSDYIKCLIDCINNFESIELKLSSSGSCKLNLIILKCYCKLNNFIINIAAILDTHDDFFGNHIEKCIILSNQLREKLKNNYTVSITNYHEILENKELQLAYLSTMHLLYDSHAVILTFMKEFSKAYDYHLKCLLYCYEIDKMREDFSAALVNSFRLLLQCTNRLLGDSISTSAYDLKIKILSESSYHLYMVINHSQNSSATTDIQFVEALKIYISVIGDLIEDHYIKNNHTTAFLIIDKALDIITHKIINALIHSTDEFRILLQTLLAHHSKMLISYYSTNLKNCDCAQLKARAKRDLLRFERLQSLVPLDYIELEEDVKLSKILERSLNKVINYGINKEIISFILGNTMARISYDDKDYWAALRIFKLTSILLEKSAVRYYKYATSRLLTKYHIGCCYYALSLQTSESNIQRALAYAKSAINIFQELEGASHTMLQSIPLCIRRLNQLIKKFEIDSSEVDLADTFFSLVIR